MKVVTAFYSGGTEGQVLKLAKTLDRNRFDLQFTSLRKEGDLLREYQALNLPISEFKIKNLYSPYTLFQQLRFAVHLKKQKTEIMHSYNFYSNVFAIPAARLANVPLILASIRDCGVYLTPMQKNVQRFVCNLADRILVNAVSIREWLLEQGVDERKIVLIRNGIDMSVYHESLRTVALQRELQIPSGTPIVVMLSRLNPQKGVEDFIKAAGLINRSHPEVWYLVVGEKLQFIDGVFSEDKEYLQGLHDIAAEYGVSNRIRYTGHRLDTPDILANAAVSVLPSYSEGLSNTLLESMAAGVPIVATNVGGNPELIKDGLNGLLVPPHSPEQLAKAIISILDNPVRAKKFSINSRKLASGKYSLELMTAKTQAFYECMLLKKC